jgi:hypothetical protein
VNTSLPADWHHCEDTGAALERELERELTTGHPLFGKAVTAAARRLDCDDVLFGLNGTASVAMVHLTWSGRPEGAAWPWTELFDSLGAWRLYIEAKPEGRHL